MLFSWGCKRVPGFSIIMKNQMTEFIFSQFILKIDRFIKRAEEGCNDNLALDLRNFKEEILSYSENLAGDSKK